MQVRILTLATIVMTTDKVTAQFKAELHALLKKWDAELSTEDHWKGFAECGEDVRMTVHIPAIYDGNGETIRPGTEIDLGRIVDSTWMP